MWLGELGAGPTARCGRASVAVRPRVQQCRLLGDGATSVFLSKILEKHTPHLSRLCRTNKYRRDLLSELKFFENKLRKRGYSKQFIRDCYQKAKRNQEVNSRVVKDMQKVHVILPYRSTLNLSWCRKTVKQGSMVMKKTKCKVDIGLSFSVQKSLFRRMYRGTWFFRS